MESKEKLTEKQIWIKIAELFERYAATGKTVFESEAGICRALRSFCYDGIQFLKMKEQVCQFVDEKYWPFIYPRNRDFAMPRAIICWKLANEINKNFVLVKRISKDESVSVDEGCFRDLWEAEYFFNRKYNFNCLTEPFYIVERH